MSVFQDERYLALEPQKQEEVANQYFMDTVGIDERYAELNEDKQSQVKSKFFEDNNVSFTNQSKDREVEQQEIFDRRRKEYKERQEAKPEKETVSLKDIGASVMQGSAKTVETVGYLLGKIGLDKVGNFVKDTGAEAEQYWQDTKSEVAKVAEQNGFVKETAQGDIDYPSTITNIVRNPGKISMSVGESLSSTGLGMATGGLIGKGFTLIPKIGEGVAYAMGYGLGEGAISASQGAMETEATIQKMSHNKLMEHPEYRAVFNETKDKKKSKDLIADVAAGNTAAFNMLTTTILSSPMGYVFSPIFKGSGNIADDFTKSLFVGAFGEGIQETAQSAAEQAGQNLAIQQKADEKTKVLDGVVEAAVSGFVTGGVMGGGIATGAEIHTAYTENNQRKVRAKAMRDYATSFNFTSLTPEQQQLKAQLKEFSFTSLTPEQQKIKADLENMVFDSLSPEQRVEAQAEEARVFDIQSRFTTLTEQYQDVSFPEEVIADIELQERILNEYTTIEETAEEALAHKEPNYAENIQIEKKQDKEEEATVDDVGKFFENEAVKVNKRSEAAKARQEAKREQLEKEHGADEDKINEGMKVPQKKKVLPGTEEKYAGMSKEDLTAEEEAKHEEKETIEKKIPQEEIRDITVPEDKETTKTQISEIELKKTVEEKKTDEKGISRSEEYELSKLQEKDAEGELNIDEQMLMEDLEDKQLAAYKETKKQKPKETFFKEKPIESEKDVVSTEKHIEKIKDDLTRVKSLEARKKLFEHIKAMQGKVKAYKETTKERIQRRAKEGKEEDAQKAQDYRDKIKDKRLDFTTTEKTPIVLKDIENDITYEEAYRSRTGISHSPERRAISIIDNYTEIIQSDYEGLLKYAATPELVTTLNEEFKRYREGYVKRYKLMLARDSRVMSTMITGPANFPVRSNQKKQDAAQNALNDVVEFREKVFNKIKSKLRGTEAIKSTDEDAIPKLKKKLATLEKNHQMMKDANKIVRAKKLSDKEKIKGLNELGFDMKAIKDILSTEYTNKQGFPSYSLTNNNANIKRVKQRIASIEKMHERAETIGEEEISFDGGKLVQNYEIDRLQFFFDEKPSDEVRAQLKKNGFRYSPKNDHAWQRQITSNAQFKAKIILKNLKETETKEETNNNDKLQGISELGLDKKAIKSIKDPNTLHANPLGEIFDYFFVQTTGRINQAKNILDKIVSENITGKVKDTKFDNFVRKYLGASQSGLGLLTRKQEQSFIEHFRKLQRDLAKSDISAEEKAEQLKEQQRDLADNIFNEVSIQYLENPEARGVIEEVSLELAQELSKIREYINTLSLEAMERGIILPSQYNKWKDRYLSRLYLSTQTPQIAAKVSSGIKLYEQKSGRKIDSIIDYLMEKPSEADRLGAVLDIDKMIKTTIAKTQGNLGLEDFLRGITEKSEIVSSRHIITTPYRIANLPTKFSPLYAKDTFVPYLKDMIQNLDKTTRLSSDMQAIAQTEAEILRLEKILEFVENSSELAQSEIDTIDDDTKATLPGDKRYGVLAGLPLSKDVASLVISQFNVVNNPEMFVDKVDHAGKKLLVYFKWAKVPANIFAYPRNFQSNFFQWTMSGADPAQFFKEYAEAAFSMYKKKGEYYQIARKHGVLNTNAISVEVNDSLKVMAGELKQDSKTKKWVLDKMQTVGDAYGVIDDVAKIARIKYAIEQEGKSVEEAVNIAQNTHYDYSLTYDLIRGMRDPDLSRGMGLKLIGTLFPTYTHKTIAYLYDTLLERPVTLGLLASALFYAISGDDDETRDRIGATDYDKTIKTVHDWAKDNPMLRIDMKRLDDGTIDVTYTDVSYVVPFGSLYNAGFNIARGVKDLDIGKVAEGVGGLGIGGSPIQMIGNLVSNKDSYTKREIYFEHDSKEKAKDIAKYFGKQFSPGTFTKLISLTETKHPIIPRLAGINTYVYNSEGLANMNEYRAKDAIIDAGKRAGIYKRKIRQAQKDFRNGKITKTKLDETIKKNEEEIERWREIGEKAFNERSARSEEYKEYNSEAKKIRRVHQEFNYLRRKAKTDAKYREEFFDFKQDKDKMVQVRKKKIVNLTARRIKVIKKQREKILASARSDNSKKKMIKLLDSKENSIYSKAYKMLIKQ